MEITTDSQRFQFLEDLTDRILPARMDTIQFVRALGFRGWEHHLADAIKHTIDYPGSNRTWIVYDNTPWK